MHLSFEENIATSINNELGMQLMLLLHYWALHVNDSLPCKVLDGVIVLVKLHKEKPEAQGNISLQKKWFSFMSTITKRFYWYAHSVIILGLGSCTVQCASANHCAVTRAISKSRKINCYGWASLRQNIELAFYSLWQGDNRLYTDQIVTILK